MCKKKTQLGLQAVEIDGQLRSRGSPYQLHDATRSIYLPSRS